MIEKRLWRFVYLLFWWCIGFFSIHVIGNLAKLLTLLLFVFYLGFLAKYIVALYGWFSSIVNRKLKIVLESR